jgi:hypothetical protein
LVVAEDDIEHPVEAILAAPVAAHGVREALGRESGGREIIEER